MAKYYVYIIQSCKDHSYYIGQCDDLDARVSKHNEGMSRYTASKLPWRLMHFEIYDSRNEAIKRETAIKKKKSRNYVQWLIENRFS